MSSSSVPARSRASPLGRGALAVLERYTRRAGTSWSVISGSVLLISFVPMLGVGALAGRPCPYPRPNTK
ncbi:DUF6069 family protein [Streptosporangium sp. NBC_01639]|uniref:DUF6069 family protein n=1 Tax=Streptosporangium sp. NBC_01639 TaxID=2975948 RepID=UPI003863B01F